MIYNRPLTTREMASSRHNYQMFNLVNGMSYMCLGETVLILFAVRLNCPDTVVAVLGSMIFLGFLLLPLGQVMTARVGAARSQADFWVMRNIAALLVALAAPAALWISQGLALTLLLFGAFMFYGFRAAGVVMSQPLVGEICEPGIRGKFISQSSMMFYASGLAALVAISLLLKVSSSIWMLFSIILCGAALGVTSSGYIRRIDETEQIRASARKPALRYLGKVWRQRPIRRQLIAGMVCNLGIILTVPISMLALKRGYHVSDTQALLYALVQFGSSILASYVQTRLADRLGARLMVLGGYYFFPLICLFWLVTPAEFSWGWAVIPFVLCAFGSVTVTNSLAFYFLSTVQKDLQVVSSMFISVATGAVSGLVGMAIGSGLLKIAACWNLPENALPGYRVYFLMALMLILVAGIFVHRLEKLGARRPA